MANKESLHGRIPDIAPDWDFGILNIHAMYSHQWMLDTLMLDSHELLADLSDKKSPHSAKTHFPKFH